MMFLYDPVQEIGYNADQLIFINTVPTSDGKYQYVINFQFNSNYNPYTSIAKFATPVAALQAINSIIQGATTGVGTLT